MHGSSSAGASAPAPDRATRFVAALIDGFIASILSILLAGAPLLGGLVGAAYLVGRDGFEAGPVHYRSLGKYALGLGLVRLDGRPMTLATSVQRNWMLGLGSVAGALVTVPIVGGLLAPLVSLTGFALVLFEVYNVFASDTGQRWGDRLANTKVIETGSSVF